MAKRIPARSNRTSKCKKKKDPTAMIILFAGVGFAFILIIVVLLNSQSTTKKSMSTAKKEKRTSSKPIEQKRNNQSTQTDKTQTQKKQISKNLSKHPESEKQTNPRKKMKTRGNAGKSLEIPDNLNKFSPRDLNTLPAEFTLPDNSVGEHILTDRVRFTDDAECKIQLHSASQPGPELTRTNNKNHHWTLSAAHSNKPIANIQLTDKGITFKWDQKTNPDLRTLLHNSKMTFKSGDHKKTVQLRPITEAPNIRLFGRDAEQQYSFNLKHAPNQIQWALEPTDPNQAPFNFPTVGAPTTNGPIPITESLEWEPENNTGIVKARYVWKCTTEPGRRPQESSIQIVQKKDYKIGDSKWRPLTTDSLRRDWDGRLGKYDNVVAGIQRKILKGKYPSGKQISTLRRMIREGIAFADVRNFYYALPDRTMRIDFRTPCGISDTLLAQHPVQDRATEPFSKRPQAASPPNPKEPADTSRPQPTPPISQENEDEQWIMPPGQNPWKARQEQLENISPRGN